MNKKIIIPFVLLLFSSLYSEDRVFWVAYSNNSLREVVTYFLNDLSLVLNNTEINSVLIKDKSELSNYERYFYISLEKNNRIKVTYFNRNVEKNFITIIGRYSSIMAIKALLGYNVPIVKKKVIIFDFLDKSPNDYRIEGFGSVYSFNLSTILQNTNNFNIVVSNKPYTEDIKGFDVYVYGFYVNNRNVVTLYSYVLDSSGALKFSFKDSFNFEKKDYIYFLDNVARKVSGAIIKEYVPSPPEIVYREKYIIKEREEKEEKIEEKKEEKEKQSEGISNFSGFNVKGVKVSFFKPKVYSSAGVAEIGGAFYSYLRGFNNKNFSESIEATNFFNIFILNHFYIGYRLDFSYNFDLKYVLKTFFAAGGTISISDSFFISLGLLLGYSKDSSNYYYYGNEFCLKFVLKDNFILSLGTSYTFATDLSKIYFNDVLKPFLAFSGYF